MCNKKFSINESARCVFSFFWNHWKCFSVQNPLISTPLPTVYIRASFRFNYPGAQVAMTAHCRCLFVKEMFFFQTSRRIAYLEDCFGTEGNNHWRFIKLVWFCVLQVCIAAHKTSCLFLFGSLAFYLKHGLLTVTINI